jgi:hypothetical protein
LISFIYNTSDNIVYPEKTFALHNNGSYWNKELYSDFAG